MPEDSSLVPLKSRILGVASGVLLSALLSAALVIAAAKAGITPGVSPLVVLLGWILFAKLPTTELKGFLAIMQVTGSAGAAVTAGVVFTAPIIQILYSASGENAPPVDVPTMCAAAIPASSSCR